jgi:hypothetical protein
MQFVPVACFEMGDNVSNFAAASLSRHRKGNDAINVQ